MTKPALAEPEPEPGAAVGDLTFHGELLHGAALSAGAVRGQRVALDAAASAHAAAQHVVGVQVVAALGSDGVSGKADLASPGLPKNPVGGALTPGALSLTANLPGCPQPSRCSPCPPGSPHFLLGLPRPPWASPRLFQVPKLALSSFLRPTQPHCPPPPPTLRMLGSHFLGVCLSLRPSLCLYLSSHLCACPASWGSLTLRFSWLRSVLCLSVGL